MAFLKDTDYKGVIGIDDLEIITQGDPASRTTAEESAKQQIIGYLSQRYDCTAIFTEIPEGEIDTRNRMVIMVMVDLALFHMHSQLAERMGMDIRRQRYEDAVRWLEKVANGQITPELPSFMDSSVDPLVLSYGSEPRQNHSW